MPPRSAVLSLPEDIRAWLDAELVRRGFKDYVELEELLASKGYGISKSALHRYGSGFEERIAKLTLVTQQAKAIAEAAGDDEGAMNDALIRLIQQKSFDVLMELEREEGADPPSLTDLGHMVARLGQASVAQKRWQIQARDRIRQKLAALEKEAGGGKPGLDPATLRRVREEIYGIV